MANELVVFEEKNIALPSDMDGALMENLGDDAEITALNLPRVTVSSGSTRLEIPDPMGDVQLQDEVEMWPVHVSPTVRRFYRTAYDPGESLPPDCFSVGGKEGVGDPGGECKTCPYSQWGSAREGAGQACSTYKYVYMMLPGLFLPVLLTVPPTSQGALREFLLNCAMRNQVYWHTLVRASLKEGNTPAPVLTFKLLSVLPPEGHAELDRAHKYIQEQFPIPAGREDVGDLEGNTIDGESRPVKEEPIDV